MDKKIDVMLHPFKMYFRSRFTTELPYLDHLVAYAFNRSGKNIRTQLMVSLAMDQGIAPDDHRLLKITTAVELVHAGSLFHDDVIDDSPIRRGRPAVHTLFGSKASILLGDYGFTQAYLVIQELEKEESLLLLPKLANTAKSLVEGELWQLQWRNKPLTLQDYKKIIHLKTGCLFQFACECLQIFQPFEESKVEKLESFGKSFGSLYQLLDDYQDYYHNAASLKKEPGQDFRERKVTLPILLAIDIGILSFEEFFDPNLSFEELLERLAPIQSLCLETLRYHYDKCRAILEAEFPSALYILEGMASKATTSSKHEESLL